MRNFLLQLHVKGKAGKTGKMSFVGPVKDNAEAFQPQPLNTDP